MQIQSQNFASPQWCENLSTWLSERLLALEAEEIFANSYSSWWVQSSEGLKLFESPFSSQDEFMHFLQMLAARQGILFNSQRPFCGGILDPGGLRFQMVHTQIAQPGPLFCLRRPLDSTVMNRFLAQLKASDSEIAEQVFGDSPILITGATGAGKSTVQRLILESYCQHERVCWLEFYPESPLSSSQWFRMQESICVQTDRQRTYDLQELLRQAMRLRPERVVFSELRDCDLDTFCQGSMTGHYPCMATFHAPRGKGLLSRIQQSASAASQSYLFETGFIQIHVERKSSQLLLSVDRLQGAIQSEVCTVHLDSRQH